MTVSNTPWALSRDASATAKGKWCSPFRSCGGLANRRSCTKFWLWLKLSVIQEKGTIFLVVSTAPTQPPLAPPVHTRVPVVRSAAPTPRQDAARGRIQLTDLERGLHRLSLPALGCPDVSRHLRGESGEVGPAEARPMPRRRGDRGYLEDALLLPPLVLGQRSL